MNPIIKRKTGCVSLYCPKIMYRIVKQSTSNLSVCPWCHVPFLSVKQKAYIFCTFFSKSYEWLLSFSSVSEYWMQYIESLLQFVGSFSLKKNKDGNWYKIFVLIQRRSMKGWTQENSKAALVMTEFCLGFCSHYCYHLLLHCAHQAHIHY